MNLESIVIDALLEVLDKPFGFTGELEHIMTRNHKVLLMTTHRRENLQDLKGVYETVNRILSEHDDVELIFPVQKNPKVRDQVRSHLIQNDRVHIMEPLDYETFANLMNRAYLILTDSGGIQEEAPSLGKPVLVARVVRYE